MYADLLVPYWDLSSNMKSSKSAWFLSSIKKAIKIKNALNIFESVRSYIFLRLQDDAVYRITTLFHSILH